MKNISFATRLATVVVVIIYQQGEITAASYLVTVGLHRHQILFENLGCCNVSVYYMYESKNYGILQLTDGNLVYAHIFPSAFQFFLV